MECWHCSKKDNVQIPIKIMGHYRNKSSAMYVCSKECESIVLGKVCSGCSGYVDGMKSVDGLLYCTYSFYGDASCYVKAINDTKLDELRKCYLSIYEKIKCIKRCDSSSSLLHYFDIFNIFDQSNEDNGIPEMTNAIKIIAELRASAANNS